MRKMRIVIWRVYDVDIKDRIGLLKFDCLITYISNVLFPFREIYTIDLLSVQRE